LRHGVECMQLVVFRRLVGCITSWLLDQQQPESCTLVVDTERAHSVYNANINCCLCLQRSDKQHRVSAVHAHHGESDAKNDISTAEFADKYISYLDMVVIILLLNLTTSTCFVQPQHLASLDKHGIGLVYSTP